MHTLFGTGYTHGASRVNVTSFCSVHVLFCVHLQIDIHVSLNRDVGILKGADNRCQVSIIDTRI